MSTTKLPDVTVEDLEISPVGHRPPPTTTPPDNPNLLTSAHHAALHQQTLSLPRALRLYPTAVLWSVLLSTCIFMEAYDTMLLGNLFAQPAFARRYGVRTPAGGYEIPSAWQSGLSNGGTCGQLVGLLLAGAVTDRLGFPRTVMLGLCALAGCVFITFFAPGLGVLEAGQVLFGGFLSFFLDL
jgi:MFS transporter, SP family, general alpha glucoside:H+ symporter